MLNNTLTSEGKKCGCGCGLLTPTARHTKASKGHQKGFPLHFVPGHHDRLRARKRSLSAIKDEFYALVYPDPNTGCFIWTGRLLNNGYGSFYLDGRTIPAHRAALILEYGPIPAGLEAMHRVSCPRRDCVSLDHLSLGTHAENMQEAFRRDSCRRGKYPRGVKPNGSGFSARFMPPGTGKVKHLGTYATVEEAAAVVRKALVEVYAV